MAGDASRVRMRDLRIKWRRAHRKRGLSVASLARAAREEALGAAAHWRGAKYKDGRTYLSCNAAALASTRISTRGGKRKTAAGIGISKR